MEEELRVREGGRDIASVFLCCLVAITFASPLPIALGTHVAQQRDELAGYRRLGLAHLAEHDSVDGHQCEGWAER